jgi:hypothetical protein
MKLYQTTSDNSRQLINIITQSFITTFENVNPGKRTRRHSKSPIPVIRKKSSFRTLREPENVRQIEIALQGKLTVINLGHQSYELSILSFDNILERFYDPPIRQTDNTYYDPVNERDMSIEDVLDFINAAIKGHEAWQDDNIYWSKED